MEEHLAPLSRTNPVTAVTFRIKVRVAERILELDEREPGLSGVMHSLCLIHEVLEGRFSKLTSA